MAKQKIKNYLKKSKSVTAPMNWKSSASSPKTQLAYVTKPEIDMLVKANIYGSMNGKPNVGPKGIISLDGGGSSKKIKTKKSKGSKTSDAVRTSSYDKGGRNENKDTSKYDNPKNYQTKETKATKKDKQGFAEYVASKGGKSAFERFGGSDVNQSEIDKVQLILYLNENQQF